MQLFTVRLDNEPGALARVAEAIAARGVDIQGIGGGGIGDAGVAAFVTDDEAATREALAQANCQFETSDAVLADVDDSPGSLAKAARALADAGINLTGVLILQSMGDQARLAFGVDEAGRARDALRAAGLTGM